MPIAESVERGQPVGGRSHVVMVRRQTVPQDTRYLRFVVNYKDFLRFAHFTPRGTLRPFLFPCHYRTVELRYALPAPRLCRAQWRGRGPDRPTAARRDGRTSQTPFPAFPPECLCPDPSLKWRPPRDLLPQLSLSRSRPASTLPRSQAGCK